MEQDLPARGAKCEVVEGRRRLTLCVDQFVTCFIMYLLPGSFPFLMGSGPRRYEVLSWLYTAFFLGSIVGRIFTVPLRRRPRRSPLQARFPAKKLTLLSSAQVALMPFPGVPDAAVCLRIPASAKAAAPG